MADNEDGTTTPEGEAPETGTEPDAKATQPAVDEVTKLRSRNAGLDAKVTALSTQAKEALARAEAAEKRALELAEAKDNGDAELRAELERIKAENAQTRREAALVRIEAKYPETFGVLGEAAATLTEDQLAASEARMAGVPAETEAPTASGANPPRTPASPPKAKTADELEAELKAMTVPW